jgi:hypothetical protein
VSLWVRLTRAHAAQGGVTLGPEQGEVGANFCYLGAAHGICKTHTLGRSNNPRRSEPLDSHSNRPNGQNAEAKVKTLV